MLAQEQKIPLKIVGGTRFGRFDKISSEQTYNMIISTAGDQKGLVPYAAYKNIKTLAPTTTQGNGRGIYKSSRGNIMLTVINGSVFVIDFNLDATLVGTLATSSSTVYFAENNNKQIVINDNINLYVYNWGSAAFSISNVTPGFTIDFTPNGKMSFQNGQLQVGSYDISSMVSSWRLSNFNDALTWPNDAQHVGNIQTKSDIVEALVPIPGNGNLQVVMGKTVAELWTYTGGALFPYTKNQTQNFDFGTLNPATIDSLDTYIVWLGANEKTGPVIMYSRNGGPSQRLSNDGLDYKFSRLTAPQDAYGFLFMQDGHIIYQITFLTDNLSYAYDFNENEFYTVTDETQGNHIARNVVFFNNKYYFVAFTDGNLYEFGTQFTSFIYADDDIKEVPRFRICPPLRMVNQDNYILHSVGFTIEQGQPNEYTDNASGVPILTEDFDPLESESQQFILIETNDADNPYAFITCNMNVDMLVSIDGGASYIGSDRAMLNPTGEHRNKLIFYPNLQTNDTTLQFRFIGLDRFVCLDGEAIIKP